MQAVSSGTASHWGGWQIPQPAPATHPSSPLLGASDTRTYLHLPRVVGNDETQQDDCGEADKAFQGQGEHGVLQGKNRAGIRGGTAMGPCRCWPPRWAPHPQGDAAPLQTPASPPPALQPPQLPPHMARCGSKGTTSTASTTGTAGKSGPFSKMAFLIRFCQV